MALEEIEAGARNRIRGPGAPEGEEALVRCLLTRSPAEIVEVLTSGDPLGLRTRVARCLERRWLFADADRVQLRAVALCAMGAAAWRGSSDLAEWVDAIVQRAVDEVVTASTEASTPGADAFDSLASPLSLDPASLREACGRFNRLPEAAREAFFLLVIHGHTFEHLRDDHGLSVPRAARGARQALETLLTPDLCPPFA